MRVVEEEKGYVPLPRLLRPPANATDLQKLRHELVRERFMYLKNGSVKISIALYTPEFTFPRFWIAIADT